MNLDEVRLLFERKGIFFFKMLQIRMGLSSSDDIFPSETNYVFQAHFLFLLDRTLAEALSGEEFPGYVWLPGIINRDKKPECDLADRFMPQLLHEDTTETVPAEVKQHIAECSICKENLDRVHDILLSPDEIDEERAFCIRQITERLLEHFSYLDKTVDCRTVRRFLPQLADIELAILIPTPITAHIDQCQQCQRKLSVINQLEFTSKQLADLSEIWSRSNPAQMNEVVNGILSEDIPQNTLKSTRKFLNFLNDNEVSGITTIYQLGESPEKLEAAKAHKPYNLHTELNDHNAEMPEKWPGRPIDVGCNWIKYCLPLFVQRDLLIAGKIPLAALAHIDKCSQCKDDIIALEALKLKPEQLEVLSKFYWKFRYVPEVSPLDKDESAAFHEHIETTTDLFAQMRFDKLSIETLEHICLCHRCREIVYQKRQAMSESAVVTGQAANIPCKAVDRASLFTYCLPFGLNPANDQYAKFRSAFTSHVTNCPNCLEKLRQFHNTLYTIIDRAESGVIIKYEFNPKAADKKEACDKAHLYDGFPITVQVSDSAKPIALKPKVRHRFLRTIGIRRFIKPAAAASILIIASLFLYFGTSTAIAAELREIYNYVAKAKNICISKFTPNATEPYEKVWISQEPNVYMKKTEKQIVLLDINNNIAKRKQLDSTSSERIALTGNMLAGAKKKITGYHGIMPFANISDVPKHAEWIEITDDAKEPLLLNTKVYDLIWAEKQAEGPILYKKWRAHIKDIEGEPKLPIRIEEWWKRPEDKEFNLKTIMKIDYPTPAKILTVTEKAGF